MLEVMVTGMMMVGVCPVMVSVIVSLGKKLSCLALVPWPGQDPGPGPVPAPPGQDRRPGGAGAWQTISVCVNG